MHKIILLVSLCTLNLTVQSQDRETVFAGPLEVSVTLDNDQVQLKWKKVKGYDNQLVQLERSSNGLSFHPLGLPQLFGTETAIDRTPEVGFNYYRLTTNDNTDGAIRLSEINLIYVPGHFDTNCLATGTTQTEDPFSISYSIPDSCQSDSLTMLVPVYDIHGNKVDLPMQVDPTNSNGQLYINPDNTLLPGIYTIGKR